MRNLVKSSLFDLSTNKNMIDFANDFFGNNNWITPFVYDEKTPKVNVIDEKEKVIIEVAAPGLDKADFNIDINDNILTISSKKEDKKEEKDKKFTRKEFSYSSFSRSFTIGDDLDIEDIVAKHNNGILSIDISKKIKIDKKKSKTIDIH